MILAILEIIGLLLIQGLIVCGMYTCIKNIMRSLKARNHLKEDVKT